MEYIERDFSFGISLRGPFGGIAYRSCWDIEVLGHSVLTRMGAKDSYMHCNKSIGHYFYVSGRFKILAFENLGQTPATVKDIQRRPVLFGHSVVSVNDGSRNGDGMREIILQGHDSCHVVQEILRGIEGLYTGEILEKSSCLYVNDSYRVRLSLL